MPAADLGYLASLVRVGRPQFAEIYDPIAEQRGAYNLRMLRMVRPPSATHSSPLEPAFEQARDGGWLAELIDALLLTHALKDDEPEARVQLHGVISPEKGFLDAAHVNSGIAIALRRVCLITVSTGDGHTSGTGFLVGPQSVLTSWHVIKPLLPSIDADKPADIEGNTIKVRFDLVGNGYGTEVAVAKEWLAGLSKAHELEWAEGMLPLDIDGLSAAGFDTHLDFALIRLAVPVGRERGYYRLDRARTPRVPGPLTLLQHPGQVALRVTNGVASKLWPDAFKTRLRHDANSWPGASGGLLLDERFEPVGLHQLGLYDDQGKPLINGAIPTACIAARDLSFEATVGVDAIWQIAATGAPVFGREQFQEHAMALLSGESRVLVLRGERKVGKTFCITILREVLGKYAHAIVEMLAVELPSVPAQFAAEVLRRLGATPDVLAAIPDPGDAHTAHDAWLRDFLYPYFVTALAKLAGKRLVWLVIDGLDETPLGSSAIRGFLDLLLRDIEQLEFVRIVLIGHAGTVATAPPRRVIQHYLDPISEAELCTHMKRRVVAAGAMHKLTNLEMHCAMLYNMVRSKPGYSAVDFATTFVDIALPALERKDL